MTKIERNPRPRIRAWLDEGDNWDRAEYESFAQIAREVGISAGALTYNLRLILSWEWGMNMNSVDAVRKDRQEERKFNEQERRRKLKTPVRELY